MNSATLGANAPMGASSDVAIHAVSAAATKTPRNASTSAEPTGVTGTIAERSVCGVRSNARASAEIVARVGIPAMVVVGSTRSADIQRPPTATTASRSSAGKWRRCAQPRNAGGATAASTIANSHDRPAKTRVSANAVASVRLARATPTAIDERWAAIGPLPRSRIR